MMHSSITISSDAEAVECTGPSPNSRDLLPWPKMAITPVRLKINTSCEYERKRVMEMTQAQREKEAKRGKVRVRECYRRSAVRNLFICQSGGGRGFSFTDYFCHMDHWATELPRAALPSPTILTSAAAELCGTAALWTLMELLKLAVSVLTL